MRNVILQQLVDNIADIEYSYTIVDESISNLKSNIFSSDINETKEELYNFKNILKLMEI